MYGFYNSDLFNKIWNKKYSVYTYDKLTDTYLVTGNQNSPSNLTENYSPLQRSTVLGQLTYEKLFSQKHNVKVSLVYEEKHRKSDNMWAKKEFAIDVDQFFAGNSANSQVNSSNIYEDDNQGVIGRFNYNYLSKYLFEAAFNYGGSSKFPKGSRWGFFPYISAGWRISEEKFIKENLSFVTNLKLRGSWGKTGDDGAARFQFLSGYNYPSGNFVFNNTVVAGLGFKGMPNPNITWYTAETKNLGIDMDLWNGKLTLQFEAFRRDRSGLLATRALTLPGTFGTGLPQENLNSDMQKGFELVLGHAKRNGEMKYDISANITYTRGQNKHVEMASYGNTYINWRNNPTDRWNDIVWGYKLLGPFQNQADVLNSPQEDGQGNRTLRPGDNKYEDVNKDGIIDALDQIPITRGQIPLVNYGLNFNLSWKSFDMNLFGQGAAQFNMVYDGRYMPLTWGRNNLTLNWDRWHHADIFDVNSPWIPGRYPPVDYAPSDKWASILFHPNASYFRLKNLEIGYTFNSSLIKKVGVQSVRISASGFNLLTFKFSYLPAIDPEQQLSNYPLYKTYSIGLNVKF
jgi:TonB-linked SusC/RagA family outer membrane protein